MSAVIFSPHNDDETLFAFYTMLRYRAEIVVVLRSMRQQLEQDGPTYQRRETETLCVSRLTGLSYVQWVAFYDNDPDWHEIAYFMATYMSMTRPDVVIAPAWEDGGHEDHNAVAKIAGELEGDFELISFSTYKRGYGRSTEGEEVVPTPAEEAAKRTALGCYQSQLAHPPTAPWFGGDQREFILC